VFGGHEMSDTGNLSSQHFNKIDGSWQRRPDRSNRDQQMHAMFSLGLVACGGAADLAFDRSSSTPLLIFVSFATNYVVGRRGRGRGHGLQGGSALPPIRAPCGG